MVLGGYGRYGRHIVEQLAQTPGVECIAAGRRPPKPRANTSAAIRFLKVDANDAGSLSAALQGIDFLINATGLFSSSSQYHVAKACVAAGVHYIDLADNRDYVRGFTELDDLARRNNVLLVTAAGASPVLPVLLTDVIRHEFDSISDIRVYRSAGNRNPGGPASLSGLLEQVGEQFEVLQSGKWRVLEAWSNPQRINFPRPVGRRRCYCINSPELDVLARRYQADSVVYRMGFELGLFNIGLSLLARARKHKGITSPQRLARWLLMLSRIVRNRGSDNDALGVIVRGEKSGKQIEHGIYLVAREGAGMSIPCAPAVALIQKLLDSEASGEIKLSGASQACDLIGFEEVRRHLSTHNVVLVRA